MNIFVESDGVVYRAVDISLDPELVNFLIQNGKCMCDYCNIKESSSSEVTNLCNLCHQLTRNQDKLITWTECPNIKLSIPEEHKDTTTTRRSIRID